VRGEDAVVTVAMDARWRHEGDETLEELEGREDELGAPVRGGLGKSVEEAGVGRGEGGDAGQGMESLECEGRPGAVAEESLEAGAVVPLDAHGSVDAELTGAPPAEHAIGIGLIEEPVGAEVSEDAPLNDALEADPVLEVKERRFVEDGPSRVPILGPGEDAVEDDEVEVGMQVQRGAEAVQEADGSELRIGGRIGTGATEGGPGGPEEDAEDGACNIRVVMQEGTQALGEGQHPLANGEVGQDGIGEVGGEIGHAPGVAGGADPAALAGEGDEALVATVLAAGAGEAVGEDAATEVGEEVLLDPPGHAVAQRVGLGGPGEEGLEVVLDDGVERGGGGPARSVGGRRRGRRGGPRG
jgi:hypothetical protein